MSKRLTQYFYLYELGENTITERITFFEGERPEALAIPGWKGWLDELVHAGEAAF
ncbi:hypothetical protein [Xanthomonas phage BUDD]|nr:hypothetical protein [Xanthomonas phage BUDD]WEM34288.1 hypothetical protein [Xanthomonas phage X1]